MPRLATPGFAAQVPDRLTTGEVLDAIRADTHFEVDRFPFVDILSPSRLPGSAFSRLTLVRGDGRQHLRVRSQILAAPLWQEPLSSSVNTAQQTTYQAVSDRQGLYSFPDLPVGHYDLTISAAGFATQRKTNLTVDMDSAIREDVALVIGAESASVMVTSTTGVQWIPLRPTSAKSYRARK